MDSQQALKIMRALASGVHPETGEAFAADSLYRQREIVKALNRALAALVQADQNERRKPVNTGRYWSKEEDARMCEELRNGLDFQQIAKTHHRSIGSIVARLVKIGKISAQSSSKAA